MGNAAFQRDYKAQGINHGWTLLEQTTTPLGIAGIFTSAILIPLHNCYSELRGTVFSDVAGTLELRFIGNPDTGSLQFDAINSIPYVAASTPGIIDLTTGKGIPIIAPNLQVRYVNGGVAQTTFRLFIYGVNGI